MENIKELCREFQNVIKNNLGITRMMMNAGTGEIWNDFYTNENFYKIYYDPDIIEIPVTDIITGASDHILSNAEIAEAIEGWILKKIK